MREVPFADPDIDEVPAFLAPDDADDRPPVAPRDDDPALVLPPAGSGVRAYRRKQHRRHMLRRNRNVFLLLAAALLALLVFVARPWDSGSGGAPEQAAPSGLPATLPSSAVL